jgi:hypothetical protein
MLKVFAGGVLQPRMPAEGVQATQNGQLPIANASNCLQTPQTKCFDSLNIILN